MTGEQCHLDKKRSYEIDLESCMKGIGKHKRIIAMLLVLAMGMLCLFGGSRAYAAPETGSTSSGSSSSDDGKMSSGGVQPAELFNR